MKHLIFFSVLVLSLFSSVIMAIAHEKTNWKAPEEANKVENPIKPTEPSIEKGKEFYNRMCASCHGVNGDGKGLAGKRLNPKPTNFVESHGEKMSDGEHYWKITKGRGPMPSFEKKLTVEERWHVINYINTFMKHK
jgi:mono/diheme cytochrome c family protein